MCQSKKENRGKRKQRTLFSAVLIYELRAALKKQLAEKHVSHYSHTNENMV